MALPLPPIFYYRVDAESRFADQNVVYTFYYNEIQRLEIPGVDPLQTMAQRFISAFEAKLAACHVTSFECINLRVRRFNLQGNEATSRTFPWNWLGTIDDAGAPPMVSTVLQRKLRDTGTRRYRGRLCLAAAPLLQVAAGRVAPGSAYETALNQLAPVLKTELREPAAPAPAEWSAIPVLGDFKVKKTGDEFYRAQAITQVLLRSNLGTQRHRSPGHGRYG